MRIGTVRLLMVSALSMSVAACMASKDMQGVDPKDYYAEHPIKNKVETRDVAYVVRFAPGSPDLTSNAHDRLVSALRVASPMAANSVLIQFAQADKLSDARSKSLATALHHMGYGKDMMQFEPSTTLARNEVRIDILYSAIIAPDCPDWRASPNTTYSNTSQGNFKCATEVNTGLMVADPHDLVRGTGDVEMDSERAAKAVEEYRGGTSSKGTASSSGGSPPQPASGLTPPANPPVPQ
jgi:pilus biogenesis lipoprotein CpaD